MRARRAGASLFQTPIGWFIIAVVFACVVLFFNNTLRDRNEQIVTLKSEVHDVRSQLQDQNSAAVDMKSKFDKLIGQRKEQKIPWRLIVPEEDQLGYLDSDSPPLFGRLNDLAEPNSGKELWVGVVLARRSPTPELMKLCEKLEKKYQKDDGVYPYHKRTYRVVIVQGSENAEPSQPLPSGCKFLSTKTIETLPYRSIKNSAINRKNIGYLYAIHNNATVIFDIDDTQEEFPEPLPMEFPMRAIMDFMPFTLEKRQSNEPGVVNPYRYYGISHLRPRGFPLTKDEQDEYTFQPWVSDCGYLPDGIKHMIPIQQGLSVKHPDASKETLKAIAQSNEYFARPIPWQWGVALDKGSFMPFYDRNTVFFPPAFWGLYLPNNKAALGDVHRGYWVQRLLWDIGYNIASIPTSVERDITRYSNEEQAFVGDDVAAAKKLVRFLSDWRSEVTGLLYERILKLHRDMVKNGLQDESELIGVIDWLSDLFDLGYKMPTTSNTLWTRNFKIPESPIITQGNDTDTKKGFVYMTQTEHDIPPDTLAKVPSDSDVIIISWQWRSTNNRTIWYPGSTWTEGRNRLYQEALEVEKYRGYKYRFMVFTDDDFQIECTRAGIPKAEVTKCFEYTHKMLDKWQPAIGDCDHPTEDFVSFPAESEADVTWLDAYWNSFHREMVDLILPYNRTYDLIAWPGSQGYVRWQAHTFWRHHIMAFTKVYCWNPKHRDYARGIQMWDDIGAWIQSMLPNYFRRMLQSWPGNYLGKNGPHEVRLKGRVYDDACTLDPDSRAITYCQNES
eukprot:TRINITY_DN3677_c0_g1_i1.p1 TRINITY_DN3677_c0_g1~~TRINITY_DN3677_c0_g1_i1.p1  ORF type:complete len:784 (-),score=148.31 TRINITY_DN3677_c0_g1_i1:105-2456(-)